jgi:hypothetical protein
MHSYSKGSKGPSITVHYNGYVVSFMQGYSKGSKWPSTMVHFNGYLEAPM